MDRIPIFNVEECQALTKRLRFVISLDSQPLLRVDATETLLQFSQKVLVHLATSVGICPIARDKCSARSGTYMAARHQLDGFVSAFMANNMMRTAEVIAAWDERRPDAILARP
jgi:hypothetical protein